MRWEALFADMEAQWAAEESQDLAVEAMEALERERSQLRLDHRLRAHIGRTASLRLRGGKMIAPVISHVGSDWLAGRLGSRELLIPLPAVEGAEGLSPQGRAESSRARRRVGLGSPLRALARRGEQVVVMGEDGEIGRGAVVSVGADHLDLQRAGVRSTGNRRPMTRTIVWSAVVLISSDSGAAQQVSV